MKFQIKLYDLLLKIFHFHYNKLINYGGVEST